MDARELIKKVSTMILFDRDSEETLYAIWHHMSGYYNSSEN